MAKMPESDPSDRRKNRDQLIRAQTAWQAYVEEDCAYVGGAEGGSNLWVTNFANRCELRDIRERSRFLRKEAGLSDAPETAGTPPAPARQISPATAKQVLNMLAAQIPSDSTLPKLPPSYSNWTEEQRKTAPHQIAVRCAVIWAMMNDGGKLLLLPPAQDPNDSDNLAIGVCVAGKMPRDWPLRQKALANIDRVLARSRQLGEHLSVPSALLR
jgi:hypothetical protein